MSDLVTATSVLKRLVEQNRCDGIDAFIDNFVYETLTKCENFFNPISIASGVVEGYGWKRNIFMQEMKLRGFSINFNTDQRDGDFYTIQIPKSA